MATSDGSNLMKTTQVEVQKEFDRRNSLLIPRKKKGCTSCDAIDIMTYIEDQTNSVEIIHD